MQAERQGLTRGLTVRDQIFRPLLLRNYDTLIFSSLSCALYILFRETWFKKITAGRPR